MAAVAVITIAVMTRGYSLSERSLVRAVLLEKNEKGYTVGLLCQDVTAAADASKAGEQLCLTVGKGDGLEGAFYDAEQLFTF